MSARQRWSRAETATLVNAWEQYRDCEDRHERIAALLPGRTPTAVQQRCVSMGLRVRDCETTLTQTAVGRYLGRPQQSVSQWLRSGLLPGKHDGNRPYQITLDELWAWMEDQKSWSVWEPGALTDRAAREHFERIRADWLGTKEIAAALCIDRDTVQALIHRGRLAGVIAGHACWVHRRELEAYKLRNSDDIVSLVADLRARISRLEAALERRGILAEGYPVKARYAYQGTER